MAVSQMQGDGALAARHFRLQMHAQAFDEETEYGMVTAWMRSRFLGVDHAP